MKEMKICSGRSRAKFRTGWTVYAIARRQDGRCIVAKTLIRRRPRRSQPLSTSSIKKFFEITARANAAYCVVASIASKMDAKHIMSTNGARKILKSMKREQHKHTHFIFQAFNLSE